MFVSGSSRLLRGDPCRILDQLAQAADALRHRSSGRASGAWDRRRCRAPGGRPEPAGPSRALYPAGIGAADHPLFEAQSVLQGDDRSRMAAVQIRARSHQPLRMAAFVRSRAGVEYPDIQYHFLPAAIRYDGRAAAKSHGFQAHVGPMRSPSRGSVTLRSADPRDRPVICFNYMSHPEDWRDFRHAIRLTREIFAQAAFDPYRGRDLAGQRRSDRRRARCLHPRAYRKTEALSRRAMAAE